MQKAQAKRYLICGMLSSPLELECPLPVLVQVRKHAEEIFLFH